MDEATLFRAYGMRYNPKRPSTVGVTLAATPTATEVGVRTLTHFDPNDDSNHAEANPPGLSVVEAVIATAVEQLGKPYRLGTEGPDTFDCSGLIWFAFNTNGAKDLIGGQRRRANWYANWFRSKGQFTTAVNEAKRGDLVVYGTPGERVEHIGIYLGPTRRRAISALVNPWGVTRHRFNGISVSPVGFCIVDY